ncbi:MAG: hypothetical protein ACFN4S_09580 [Prevotella conceptionensis]
MIILPFFTMFVMALKGYIYTFAVDVYTFLLAFSSILPCIYQQNTLHFAPFYLAFSTKTHCILHQNALRLAAYCTTFSSKAQKQVRMMVSLNKNSFCCIRRLTPLSIKTNLRENRFFAARWTIGAQKWHFLC